MAQRIQLRRGTAAEWTSANPVLANGEPGVEKDTGKIKFGDGVTAWTVLPYASKGDQGIPGVADDTSVEALIKNPASKVATALTATYVPKWKANTAYAAGDKILNPNGEIVSALAAFTSGASYSAANWKQVSVSATPPVYYVDIYKDFVMGPWVTGQVNTPTTLTADAAAGSNTINVASGATYPTGAILSVQGGTATQQQYKITAGGGTNTLTVTPNIVTTLPSGTAINTLWGDASHMSDWAAFAYFLVNAKRPDGSPIIQNPGGKPIVLLGNSWFVGGGSAIANAITAKYPGANVINKGVNGNTSNQVLARFDTDVDPNAAYVIIDEPGVNDSAHGALTYRENSIRNLTTLVTKVRAIGATPVFIGPPPLQLYPNASLEMSTYLRELLASPTFPDVPATAIPKFQAPSGVPEDGSISVGASALDRTTNATQNIAIGRSSQQVNQTSSGNVSIGANTLPSLQSGNGSNIAIGLTAMYSATTAGRNVAIGQGALYNPNGVSANATLASSNSVAIGYQSGASDATDPGGVTVVGATARGNISSVAVGQNAVASGKNSMAIGAQTSATGEGSVAIGRDWTAVSASTTVNNEIKLGTALHTTKIIGRLNVAPRTPTSGADTQGAVGDITSDDNYVYVKTSTGWKRAALTTW